MACEEECLTRSLSAGVFLKNPGTISSDRRLRDGLIKRVKEKLRRYHHEKILSAILAMSLVLLLAACGSKGGEGTGNDGAKSVDLNQYYEDFMASLGADNTPAMMDVEAEALDSLYQGLSAYKTAQSVVKVAAINSVAFEFALVELENESDAQAVADIFQARVDYQVNGGALYPQTTADWENAQIITHGNVVALIVAGTEQARAVEAFEKLFA